MEKSVTTNESCEDRRLWIGNLDPRITEYHLLKLVQKHGTIEKFDLLFHRSGPLLGQPRGYAFVTYLNQRDAITAKEKLNNIQVGQKSIRVTWAHSIINEEPEKPKVDINIPALAMSKEEKKTDRMTQIQAIEAKLKLMERKAEDELKINDTVATKSSIVVQYQHNKQQTTSSGGSFKSKQYSTKRKDRFNNKPYGKSKSLR